MAEYALTYVFLLLPLDLCSCQLAVILLDGFRWDYATREPPSSLPNLWRLMNEGARAEYVQPVYPAVSFPSWTTILTGQYPGQHGILSNDMLDRSLNKTFVLHDVGAGDRDSTSDPSWWNRSEPLWATASKQGARTADYMWGLCGGQVGGGIKTEKCVGYDNFKCLDIMIFRSHLLSAVSDLKSGFDLVLLYYGNVDTQGHIHGPESGQVREEVRRVDFEIGLFLKGLEKEGLGDKVNVVLTSDHGMTSDVGWTDRSIGDYLNASDVQLMVGKSYFATIALKNTSKIEAALESLSNMEGVRAYRKEDIPEYLMDPTWPPSKYLPTPPPSSSLLAAVARAQRGGHGYLDLNSSGYEGEGSSPDMRGIFVARGPRFAKGGKVVQWIKLVDQYQVFTRVLNISGLPNEGNAERVEPFFASSSSSSSSSCSSWSLGLAASAILACKNAFPQ